MTNEIHDVKEKDTLSPDLLICETNIIVKQSFSVYFCHQINPNHVYFCIYITLETKSKDSKFYLIWFPNEFLYSVVEGKSIKETNPRIRDKVRVKDSAGTWEGIVYAAGMLLDIIIPLSFA